MYEIDNVLHRLSDIVGLPNKHFELLYIAPIRQFALGAQHTPGLINPSASLIDERLQCVLKGMKYRENFIMPEGIEPEDINHKKDLWRYATFFTLMMFDLGPSITRYKIHVIPKHDEYTVKTLFGKSHPEGAKLKLVPCSPDSRGTSLLYVPCIFPPAAIGWIQEDGDAFNNSISTILDPGHPHIFSKIVMHSFVATSPEETNTTAPIKQTPPASNKNTGILKVESSVSSSQDTELTGKQIGAAFFNWLLDYLKNADHVSDPRILLTSDGNFGFKAPDIFMHFASMHGFDWKTVKNGFNKLSLHMLSSSNGKNSDLHKIKDANGEPSNWLVIPKEKVPGGDRQTEFTDGNFLSWLNSNIKSASALGSLSDPLYFTTDNHVYLITPSIFDYFRDATNSRLTSMELEHDFLKRKLHETTAQGDLFEIPLKDRRVKAIKLLKTNLNAE